VHGPDIFPNNASEHRLLHFVDLLVETCIKMRLSRINDAIVYALFTTARTFEPLWIGSDHLYFQIIPFRMAFTTLICQSEYSIKVLKLHYLWQMTS